MPVPTFGAQISNEILDMFRQKFLSCISHGFGWCQTMQLLFLFLHQLAQFFLSHLLVGYVQRNIQNLPLAIYADSCGIQSGRYPLAVAPTLWPVKCLNHILIPFHRQCGHHALGAIAPDILSHPIQTNAPDAQVQALAVCPG
ncbi:MAG: hypothetical protein ABSF51_05295 [Verrucomicrobiota bacterium]